MGAAGGSRGTSHHSGDAVVVCDRCATGLSRHRELVEENLRALWREAHPLCRHVPFCP